MEKFHSFLSEDYDELLIKNILKFKEKAQAGMNKSYSLFYPSFGAPKHKKPEFLIYGQAVKGWSPEFNLSEEINTSELLLKAIAYSNEYYKKKNHSTLDWVNVYWSKATYEKFVTTKDEKEFYKPMSYLTCRSFFWNVIYKLICRKYKLDENYWDWSKKLVWSNLCKIAPSDKMNPNDNENNWQIDYSTELVKKEISEIDPKYCIVITNDTWWEPYRAHLKTKKTSPISKNGIIESVEQYENTKIIVTTRPFSGSSHNHVDEIIKLL